MRIKFVLNFILICLLSLFTGEKSYSLSSEKISEKGKPSSRQWRHGRLGRPFPGKTLLLNEKDGLLPESESRKIISRMDQPLAKELIVGRNEWLEKIAKDFGVPAISIRSTNNLDDPYLHPGQRIVAQNKKGIFHIAKKDETVEAMIKTYEKLGGKRAEILRANLLDEKTYLKDGMFYLKEGVGVWIPSAHRRFPYLFTPVAYKRISSPMGVRRHPILKVRKFHFGDDLAAPFGAPVHAGAAGTVVYAGWLEGYGNVIDIMHGKLMTRYGHLSKVSVEIGQKVKGKQLIGKVGSSGLSTGPHLHFEVFKNGKRVNPRTYY